MALYHCMSTPGALDWRGSQGYEHIGADLHKLIGLPGQSKGERDAEGVEGVVGNGDGVYRILLPIWLGDLGCRELPRMGPGGVTVHFAASHLAVSHCLINPT